MAGGQLRLFSLRDSDVRARLLFAEGVTEHDLGSAVDLDRHFRIGDAAGGLESIPEPATRAEVGRKRRTVLRKLQTQDALFGRREIQETGAVEKVLEHVAVDDHHRLIGPLPRQVPAELQPLVSLSVQDAAGQKQDEPRVVYFSDGGAGFAADGQVGRRKGGALPGEEQVYFPVNLGTGFRFDLPVQDGGHGLLEFFGDGLPPTCLGHHAVHFVDVGLVAEPVLPAVRAKRRVLAFRRGWQRVEGARAHLENIVIVEPVGAAGHGASHFAPLLEFLEHVLHGIHGDGVVVSVRVAVQVRDGVNDLVLAQEAVQVNSVRRSRAQKGAVLSTPALGRPDPLGQLL